jgi:BlaI family penicillinase repressor
MDVLRRLGEASVREVREALTETRRPATPPCHHPATRGKGAVERTRQIGNALMFAPAVTRKSAYRRVVDDLLRLFGGSARPVVAHLLESGQLTLEDLKALAKQERARRKKGTTELIEHLMISTRRGAGHARRASDPAIEVPPIAPGVFDGTNGAAPMVSSSAG